MSSDLTSLVYRIQPPHVTPNEKLTLLALADYSGATGKIFPTYEHLCLKTCIKRRTQINVVTSLVKKGFLAKVHQFKLVNGRPCNSSNAYCLNYELLLKLAVPVKKPVEPGPKFNFAEYKQEEDSANYAAPPTYENSNPPVQQMHSPSASDAPNSCKPCTQNSSLNSSSKELASDEKKGAKEWLNAMRKSAEKKEARMAPKEEVINQPTPQRAPASPITQRLIKAGIRESKITSIIKTYPEAQIEQALTKLATKQGVRNAEAMFMTLVKEPVEISQAEQERAARLHREAVEEQKRREAAEIGDRLKQANIENPERTQSRIEQMRLAVKTGMVQARSASHG